MEFKLIATTLAEGYTLANDVTVDRTLFKEGRTLSIHDVTYLIRLGINQIVVVRASEGEVSDNDAVATIGAVICGDEVRAAGPTTGRLNVLSTTSGLLLVDVNRVVQLNMLGSGISLATLRPHSRVKPGDRIATLKGLYHYFHGDVVERCLSVVRLGDPLLKVAGFRHLKVGLLLTRMASKEASGLEQSASRLFEWIRGVNSSLSVQNTVIEDDQLALEKTLRAFLEADIDTLLIGCDTPILHEKHWIPSTVRRCGGTLSRLSLPIDPGNLVAVGRLDQIALIGVSFWRDLPVEHGCRVVLERLAAGISCEDRDIAELSIGGLLKESTL